MAASPYTPYLVIRNAGTVLAFFPIQFLPTSGPTAVTTPAASYPSFAGSWGASRYWPLRNNTSARFSPIDLIYPASGFVPPELQHFRSTHPFEPDNLCDF